MTTDQLLIAVATVIAAAAAAVVVGRSRGLATVSSRTDAEMERLISALERRVKVLTDDLRDAQVEIAKLLQETEHLRAEIVLLRNDLAEERRITARIVGPT